MIDDLDRSIQQLLRYALPAALFDQISVSFAAPDSEFPPAAVTLPAIDVFLYDIRENADLRENRWDIERQPFGAATRSRGLSRVDCSYFITAWPSDSSTTPAFDEHRLLSEVMLAASFPHSAGAGAGRRAARPRCASADQHSAAEPAPKCRRVLAGAWRKAQSGAELHRHHHCARRPA